MRYIQIFVMFFFGVVVGFILAYVLKIRDDFQRDVFNQSLVLSKHHKIAHSYFEEEPDAFKEFILCQIIEEDGRMMGLSYRSNGSDFFENSLYGGKDVLKTTSRFLFEDLGLSYDSYREKCDSVKK